MYGFVQFRLMWRLMPGVVSARLCPRRINP